MDLNKTKQAMQERTAAVKTGFSAGVRKMTRFLLIIAVIVAIGYPVIRFWSFIFSRQVVGVIEKVERIEVNVALMQSNDPKQGLNDDLFSFAVAIREESGEIVTASADDRQWAVAQQGQCAVATYYPYPPWRLDKAGTYFGARLTKLSQCEK